MNILWLNVIPGQAKNTKVTNTDDKYAKTLL